MLHTKGLRNYKNGRFFSSIQNFLINIFIFYINFAINILKYIFGYYKMNNRGAGIKFGRFES